MRLDTSTVRYLSNEDWRVLTAVHDGYRLTYGGLDYLALHTLQKQNAVYSVGNQIGMGKESDIIVVASQTGEQMILKIHRLGRISFRTVKNNRDYLRHRKSASWMYMSRLAALKEYSFMNALREAGFAVPRPIAQNRHVILMSLEEAFPLRQIEQVGDPPGLYAELMEMIVRLAGVGLIHGDFNEFNILVKEDGEVGQQQDNPSATEESKPTAPTKSPPQPQSPSSHPPSATPILIDFPQMLSIDHPDAASYFSRDVNCIKTFFTRRFHFTSDDPGPFFEDVKKEAVKEEGFSERRIDVKVEASGFSRKMVRELEGYMRKVGVDGDQGGGEEGEGEGSGGSEEEGEEEEEEEEEEGKGEGVAGEDLREELQV
ncbi:MAG: hypothetical protein Q9227_006797 [Pyrenula ochraceoflavens]